MKTEIAPSILKEVPALIGHKYAFILIRGGWLNRGMVDDDKRSWWANYWMSNEDKSGGAAHGQRAAQVAFVPFCYDNNNWMSSGAIERNAVEISQPVPIAQWPSVGQTFEQAQAGHDAAVARARSDV